MSGIPAVRDALLVLAASSSGCSEDSERASGPQAVAQLTADQSVLPQPLLADAQDLELEGAWQVSWMIGYDGEDLDVRKKEPGVYELSFLRHSCMGLSESTTMAYWLGGGLWLADPFMIFGPETVMSVLYPARVDSQDCLIPDWCLRKLGRKKEWTRLLWNRKDAFEYAFRRLDSAQAAKADERRAAWSRVPGGSAEASSAR